MTAATRSLIANARAAAKQLRGLADYLVANRVFGTDELRQQADALDRDAAVVEAEAAVVIGTDDDSEPEWEIGPLDRKW